MTESDFYNAAAQFNRDNRMEDPDKWSEAIDLLSLAWALLHASEDKVQRHLALEIEGFFE